MEKESTLALFKRLESDVKICLEKDLDTDAELKKQKEFTNNFTAMLDFLVKLNAPSGIQNEIKDILNLIGGWDVYAYWFKEMKELVVKIKGFMADFTSFAEGVGIIPKTQKPVEKPVPPPVEKAGVPPPTKPMPPSLLKPIVMGASPQKPTPPSLPGVGLASRPAASPDASTPLEAKARTVPLLKPVFKMPAVKMLAQDKTTPPSSAPAAVTPQASRPVETPAIDASSAPVPLKTLVDEKKLEIHVKPVKLIKPILAVQHAAPAVEELPKKAEPPAKPLVPALGSRSMVSGAPKPVVPSTSKSAGGEKPLLIPKPIKIVVPDLGNINIENEISGEKMGNEKAITRPPGFDGEGALFSDMGVIDGAIPVKTTPTRIVKPIPVNIQINKSPEADPNDEIVDNVVAKVSKRLDSMKPAGQKAPTLSRKPAPAEDEYITPMEVSPDDIDEWTVEEQSKPAVSPSPVKPGDARKKDVVEMLNAAESWDDEEISSILDDAMGEGTATPPVSAAEKGKTPGPVTLKPVVSTFVPEAEDEAGMASLGIIDQEPKKTRLQDIRKAEPATVAAPEPVDSMSLFMGGLGSKRSDRKPTTSAPGFSLFHPAGMAETPAPTAPSSSMMSSTTKKQQPTAPIGSDVDVESLPDTKDGLYQALIALEGKRYAIERARKDLRADLDKGIIKAPAYEQKLSDLKGEMDKIADKIKEIREKIKKFK